MPKDPGRPGFVDDHEHGRIAVRGGRPVSFAVRSTPRRRPGRITGDDVDWLPQAADRADYVVGAEPAGPDAISYVFAQSPYGMHLSATACPEITEIAALRAALSDVNRFDQRVKDLTHENSRRRDGGGGQPHHPLPGTRVAFLAWRSPDPPRPDGLLPLQAHGTKIRPVIIRSAPELRSSNDEHISTISCPGRSVVSLSAHPAYRWRMTPRARQNRPGHH